MKTRPATHIVKSFSLTQHTYNQLKELCDKWEENPSRAVARLISEKHTLTFRSVKPKKSYEESKL